MKFVIFIFCSLFLALLASKTVIGCSGGSGGGGGGGTNLAVIRERIASTGESYVGSTRWCFKCPSGHGEDTNKCNYFVYDVGREAGAKMPIRRRFGFDRGPVGAGQEGWGTASSLDYWTRVSSPGRGDIVSARATTGDRAYHVGIYVAHGTTVSANNIDVGRKNWPFGGGYEGIVYWRYTG